jgi:hypothetical protein
MAQLREKPEIVRSVKNTSGGTLPKGTIVKLKLTPVVPQEVIAAAAATDNLYGVLLADLLDGQWGTACVKGLCLVRGGAAVAVGDAVTSDADGEGVPAAAGNNAIGVAYTIGADNTLFECEVGAGVGQDS